MRKTFTVGGHAAFGIRLPIIFTLRDFARALGQESYKGPYETPGIDFEKLTKSEAFEILKVRLERHGRNGEFEGLDDLGEYQNLLNDECDKAFDWVKKHYPYLNETKKH